MEYLEKRQKSDPSFTYEVVVVNDGSPDNTSQVSYIRYCMRVEVHFCAQEAVKFVRQYGCDKIRLLELDKNRGKGGAVRVVGECYPGDLSYLHYISGVSECEGRESTLPGC